MEGTVNRTPQPARRPRPAPARVGLSLIEVTVSVTIAGILAGLAVTSVASSEGEQLAAAARTLAADVRVARALAVEHDAEVTLTPNPAENTYELTAPPGVPLPRRTPGGGAAGGAGAYAVDLSELISPRVRIERAVTMSSGGGRDEVVFRPDGTVAGGGDVLLWVRGGTDVDWRFMRLRVSAVTGTVRIEGPWPGDANFRDRLLTDTDAPPDRG